MAHLKRHFTARDVSVRAVSDFPRHAFEVGIDHEFDESLEIDGRLPAEFFLHLLTVTKELVHFGPSDKPRVRHHVLFPVEARMGEGLLHKLLHRECPARGGQGGRGSPGFGSGLVAEGDGRAG